ncbi:MAG TPA: hypothetical protein IGR64_04045 [Leptolyngbyaceae cyanobacterium M65_K2018_010]|nr:hypothetical protein [Leptolyngbyaceae cyanobacterium M65_K2018_010]
MPQDTVYFLLKVLGLSALLSGLIKFGAVWLPLAPSPTLIGGLLLAPSLLMAAWLGLGYRSDHDSQA